MNTDEIYMEAQRRFDAMDPQAREKRIAELRRKLEQKDAAFEIYRKGNPFGDKEARKKFRQADASFMILGNELERIQKGAGLMERSELDAVETHYGLTKDELRTADPKGGRARIRRRLIRWLESILVLAVALVLALAMDLRGGVNGYVVYVILSFLSVMSIYELTGVFAELKWNRMYKKYVRELSDPALQEQEIVLRVDSLMLAEAKVRHEAAKAEKQAAEAAGTV